MEHADILFTLNKATMNHKSTLSLFLPLVKMSVLINSAFLEMKSYQFTQYTVCVKDIQNQPYLSTPNVSKLNCHYATWLKQMI